MEKTDFPISFLISQTREREDAMKQEKKSRREALGLIGKAGVYLGAGLAFFTSLKIYPEQGAQLKRAGNGQEKAVISGSGTKLIVQISAKPGRHYFVAGAAGDVVENYRMIPNSKGVIGRGGFAKVIINTANIENSRIFLRIVTAKTEAFDTGRAKTEAFIINTKEGGILGYEGAVNRPIVGTGASAVAVKALLASGAGFTPGKYRLI